MAYLGLDELRIEKIDESSSLPLILVSAGVPVVGVSSLLALLYFFRDKLKNIKIVKSISKKILKIKNKLPDEFDLNNIGNFEKSIKTERDLSEDLELELDDSEENVENEEKSTENNEEKTNMKKNYNKKAIKKVDNKRSDLNSTRIHSSNESRFSQTGKRYFIDEENKEVSRKLFTINDESRNCIRCSNLECSKNSENDVEYIRNDYKGDYQHYLNPVVIVNNRCRECDLRNALNYCQFVEYHEDLSRNRIFQYKLNCNECEQRIASGINRSVDYKNKFQSLKINSSQIKAKTLKEKVEDDYLTFF